MYQVLIEAIAPTFSPWGNLATTECVTAQNPDACDAPLSKSETMNDMKLPRDLQTSPASTAGDISSTSLKGRTSNISRNMNDCISFVLRSH